MKTELIIFGITGVLIANTYYDGKIFDYFKVSKKYAQMALIGFVGLSLYLIFKRSPKESQSLLAHANQIIKYAPIDRGTKDFMMPFFDLTKQEAEHSAQYSGGAMPTMSPSTARVLNSGGTPSIKTSGTTSRSVSETKKKYVAASQSWMCGTCGKQLDATFEVDHIIALKDGGSNHVSNLTALCRNCHGHKTMMDKIDL
jgi:5-methylcytosine-specific restriction endonuclease McrA